MGAFEQSLANFLGNLYGCPAFRRTTVRRWKRPTPA